MSSLKERKVQVLNQSYMNAKQQQDQIKNRKKQLLIRRLSVFFVFFGIIIFFLLGRIDSQREILEVKQSELQSLKEEYQQLKHQEALLQEEIIKLQDEEYIGKYARQEYFLSNDGEIIFSIPKKEDKEDSD